MIEDNNKVLTFGEWPLSDAERKRLRELIKSANEKAHLIPADPDIARQEAKQARAKTKARQKKK
jgi:uncharacterized membrane protein